MTPAARGGDASSVETQWVFHHRRRGLAFAAAGAALLAAPAAVAAQSRESVSLQGFGMAGVTSFSASQTFDAILDTHSGPIFGGGLRLIIPGGPYVEVGAWRFSQDGERVFASGNGQVFPLGIPTTVRMTPLEVTGGWRFRGLFGRRVTPYLGAGEDVSDRFNGYHLTGGAELRLGRWVALTGDVMWTSVGDAIGSGGVSEVFEEDDLGGTTVRVRLILGR
jgi:hypothetical protein